MDEEDGTVQFTHQTVNSFLLDGFRDQTYADFHFQHPQINHNAGEICVAYFNFDDFKRKLIRQPKALSLPASEAILQASLSSSLYPKPAFVWEQLARFKGRYKGENSDSGHVLSAEALCKNLGEVMELQQEHPFLLYASEYWLHHSAFFERSNTQTWHLWERLLFSEDGLAQMPWEYIEWARRTSTISQWICNHEHVALYAIIVSSGTPFSEVENQYILNCAIERNSLQLLDFILQVSLCSNRMLGRYLVHEAGGRYLEAADGLFINEADVNIEVGL